MSARTLSIISLPLTGGSGEKVPPIDVPVLFVLDGDRPGPYWQCASYLWHRLITGSMRAREAALMAACMKRFIQLHDVFISTVSSTALTATDLLSIYCSMRFLGSSLFTKSIGQELEWTAAAGSTVRKEFKLLADFLQYHGSHFGTIDLNGATLTFDSNNSFVKNARRQKTTQDFLVHLSTQREKWEALLNKKEIQPPSILRETSALRLNRAERAISEEEYREIVRRETNPVFAALFILYGCGGLRLSEPLHFWQIDILPSTHWTHISNTPSENPLIIRAHPSESKFLGHFVKAGDSRKEFLRKRYNLTPRNLLAETDILYSGWKGTKFLHKLMFVPVFFLADTPMIRLFYGAIETIQRFHQLNRTSDKHPYFFANMHSRRAEFFGMPTTISNVQGAWNRAVERVGLKSHQANRNIHGLRHLYVAKAADMGLNKYQVQDILGHSNEESQRVYGNRLSKVHEAIEKAKTK